MDLVGFYICKVSISVYAVIIFFVYLIDFCFWILLYGSSNYLAVMFYRYIIRVQFD